MDKNNVTITVHSGSFHADDIFAVATLELFLSQEQKEVRVIRTRETEIIEKSDIAVDVGGLYDPEKKRFDHHQKEKPANRPNGIPYASFGLVWKEYGEKMCGSQEIADKIDQKLVQPIDAIDNGVEIVQPIFENIYPYNLYDFFDVLLPTWIENEKKEIDIDQIFSEATTYAKKVLNREIVRAKDKEEAKKLVLEQYHNSKDKRLIVFDRFLPSGEFLSAFPEPLFVIFPREDQTWSLKTVRDDPNSFKNRKDLPESWAGKNKEDLEQMTGVKGAIFCHSGRFLAVAENKEAILKLADIALRD